MTLDDGRRIIAHIERGTSPAEQRRPDPRDNGGAPGDLPKVTFTEGKGGKTEGKGGKKALVLPPLPKSDDLAGLAAWLTAVLNLDAHHPVTGAVHQGIRGQEGHAVIRRADAADLRFEPAAALNTSRRLRSALIWQLIPSDGEPFGYSDGDATRIAYVVRMLCGASAAPSEAQETEAILGTFLIDAEPVEGFTTYDTERRYEAIDALRGAIDSNTGRQIGRPRYLIDADTGELVIRATVTCKPPLDGTRAHHCRAAGSTRGWTASAGGGLSCRASSSTTANTEGDTSNARSTAGCSPPMTMRRQREHRLGTPLHRCTYIYARA